MLHVPWLLTIACTCREPQSLDTRDSLKSTRNAIIVQEVLSVRQENNRWVVRLACQSSRAPLPLNACCALRRLFQERNRVRDQCHNVRRQLRRLRENLARVCYVKNESAEEHLLRLGIPPEVFDGPQGGAAADGSGVKSPRTSSPRSLSPRSPKHHGANHAKPTDGNRLSVGTSVRSHLLDLQIHTAPSVRSTDQFADTTRAAQDRVANLDTPSSLAAVADGAAMVSVRETNKRGELECIVAQLVGSKQRELEDQQFRHRQLKFMLTRARDQLREMQHKVQKANEAARELVRGLGSKYCWIVRARSRMQHTHSWW